MRQDLAREASTRASNIRRLTRAMMVFAVLAATANVIVYAITRAWQYLGGAAVFIATLAVGWHILGLLRRHRDHAAAVWMLAAPLILIPLASLLWQGVSLSLALIAFGIGSLFATLVLAPQRRTALVLVSALVGLVIWLARALPLPWDRFDVTGYAVTGIISGVLVAGAMGIVAWQLSIAYRQLIAIRSRLIVTFIAIVITVALAVSLTSILLGIQTTQRRTFDQLSTALVLKTQAVDTWLDQLRYSLESLVVEEDEVQRAQSVLLRSAAEDNRIAAAQELRGRFSTLIERTGWFTEIYLIDIDGEVVLSTDPDAEGRSVAGHAYFEEALTDFTIAPPRYDPLVDGITIVVARPLQLEASTYGIVAARTDMGELNTIASTGRIGETGTTAFVSTDHVLLTGSGVAGGYIPVQSEAIEDVLGRPMGIQQGIYTSHKGVRVSGTSLWLPRFQVALLVEQDQAEVLSGAILTSLANAGVALLAVMIAVIVAIGFANSISHPLSDLAITATSVAEGDLGLTAEVVRDDEIGAVARAFNAMTAQLRDLIASLEQRVEERTRGLQAAAEVSRATTSVLDLDQLLPQVVDLARQRFDLYYVGLFLLDEQGRNAVLRAGTGEAGREMIAQGWSLETGGESMIGQCVATGEPMIKQQEGDEVVRFENPWLPDTRSELALPLRYGGSVIGAMTVQSVRAGAFDETGMVVLQNLADQVAVAVENARLFAETQSALERVRRAQRRYERQAWSEYLTNAYRAGESGRSGYGYRMSGDAVQPIVPDQGLFPDLQVPEIRAELSAGQLVVCDSTNGHDGDETAHQREGEARPPTADRQILVPILQSGEVIGALGVERAEDWSDDDVALVRNLAEQLALAAENQRLLDATQRREAAERLTREITTRMRQTLDVGQVLRAAVHGFADAFGAEEVTVRLASRDEGASPGTAPASDLPARSILAESADEGHSGQRDGEEAGAPGTSTAEDEEAAL